ncbi:P-loop containing nucleoside triphosphate hydrolase protein [Bombardia bombarda]|uniref:P-loop containing nucleoside triphosphate hydrolase protein n=1 Tax=Bombardia bombarda TaxID=252184 RepID=A0AA39XI24_9PEZI|nr:P-loop containing nucleoside triphosphate hydrolase protein [Bombardia bombarda]
MQVLCVGLPRSGTESLAQALAILGYDHTYHGWDIVYDSECHSPGWVRLVRKKWYPDTIPNKEDREITATDFDALLGHSVAVTDAAASVFAAEMVRAYPEAKVVLNMRRDVDGWVESLGRTLVRANESWGFWVASWLDRECFWAWHVYERFMWPLLFRAGGVEHSSMIRGLVPKERLLEWYIEDGWEPLCKFLGKPVPDVEFPHANAANGGWKARELQCNKRWVERAFVNLLLIIVGTIVVGALAVTYVF